MNPGRKHREHRYTELGSPRKCPAYLFSAYTLTDSVPSSSVHMP